MFPHLEKQMRQADYPHTDAQQSAAVDSYFAALLAPSDAALEQTLAANAQAGMPAHDVSALQGKFLALLVRMTQARRVLEIGCLGGYSSIWMARALPPQGLLVSIENNASHARIAQANLERAGVADRVRLHTGAALEVLPSLQGPFDLVFIDADKPNNPHYLEWAISLSRPGTVIVGDNVVRGGAVVDPHSIDPSVKGVRQFLESMAVHPRLDSTALQTLGEKGWDGFSLSVVKP